MAKKLLMILAGLIVLAWGIYSIATAATGGLIMPGIFTIIWLIMWTQIIVPEERENSNYFPTEQTTNNIRNLSEWEAIRRRHK